MNFQSNPQRFYIHTLGCKVNQYESQVMREILLKAGFNECLSKEKADIYVINTCTVTHHADRESRYLVGAFHRANPQAKIVVAGCYVEKNADEVSSLPGVAHIVRNEEKTGIADILNGLPAAKQRGSKHSLPEGDEPAITGFNGRTKAFVKIQDGCENKCSYCKVPLVRSVLRSKPLDKVVEEVKGLVSHGFKEIILAGICLGAWGKELSSSEIFTDMLEALEKIDGDFRIRLSSIEPKYVTDELIDFIAGSKKMCRHLHIPLQSGDDEILRRMNRPYTSSEYCSLIEKLRSSMKEIAVSTDVMVGFPGETDANFRNTLNLLKQISPARTHIFTFSKRDGTEASKMAGTLDEETARRRYYALKTVVIMLSYLYCVKFLHRKLDVLVETKRDKDSGLLTGYSDNYIKVLFEGDDALMRTIVPVTIEEMTLSYVWGRYAAV